MRELARATNERRLATSDRHSNSDESTDLKSTIDQKALLETRPKRVQWRALLLPAAASCCGGAAGARGSGGIQQKRRRFTIDECKENTKRENSFKKAPPSGSVAPTWSALRFSKPKLGSKSKMCR
jgi:hypothetical protein